MAPRALSAFRSCENAAIYREDDTMHARTLVSITLTLSAAFQSAGAIAGPAYLIHAGTLLAVPGEAPKARQSIVVRDGRIAEVRDGFIDPRDIGDVEVVNLADRFVLPGLIDAHVHLLVEQGPEYKLNLVAKSDADRAFDGALFARRTLEAGFTTVRDVASTGQATFALRDAIAAGHVPGPRMLAAGNALWATGHLSGFRPDVLALFDTTTDCDGADDCRRAVRAQVGRGADVIKLHATGAVLNEVDSWLEQQLTDEELQAIMETAHALGRRTAAHAHGVKGINAALRAGVDSIEHGSFLDDSSIALFKTHGAYLVPTLMATEALTARSAANASLSPIEREKAAAVGRAMQDAAARAREAGVKIAFGSDSGVTPHGDNAREFELLVAAGMTPMEAIRAATVSCADLLGLADQIGTLEPGKAADLIATAGNPLEDVGALRDVGFVMRAGVIYKDLFHPLDRSR
jgi:imidazolonepropionase-like amidohydrolase